MDDIDFYLFGKNFKKRDDFYYTQLIFKLLYNQAKMHH